MKKLVTKSTLYTSKINSQIIGVAITIGTMIIFSLIAGAPVCGSGGGC